MSIELQVFWVNALMGKRDEKYPADSEVAGLSDVLCPSCGSKELVQAYVWSYWGFKFRRGARCTVCGARWKVSDEDYEALRMPVLGEPYETEHDRCRYMLETPMRPWHTVCCLLGLFAGWLGAGCLVVHYDQPWGIILFVPILYAGWWLGRWIQPPVERAPGRCAECCYDLRGQVSDYCPECGTRIEAEFSADGVDSKAEEGDSSGDSVADRFVE